MSTIGIRELSQNVSRHLDQVRAGHTLVITDHGKPIARIVPAGPTVLDQLVAQGRVTPPATRGRHIPNPVTEGVTGTVSDLVEDQRR